MNQFHVEEQKEFIFNILPEIFWLDKFNFRKMKPILLRSILIVTVLCFISSCHNAIVTPISENTVSAASSTPSLGVNTTLSAVYFTGFKTAKAIVPFQGAVIILCSAILRCLPPRKHRSSLFREPIIETIAVTVECKQLFF